MRTVRSGEEVNYLGKRWMVSQIDLRRMSPYRLLRTEPTGTEVEWVTRDQLQRIESYVRPVEDTAGA